jgi:hypothetical protein
MRQLFRVKKLFYLTFIFLFPLWFPFLPSSLLPLLRLLQECRLSDHPHAAQAAVGHDVQVSRAVPLAGPVQCVHQCTGEALEEYRGGDSVAFLVEDVATDVRVPCNAQGVGGIQPVRQVGARVCFVRKEGSCATTGEEVVVGFPRAYSKNSCSRSC